MVNSLPSDKLLDWSKLKPYAGDTMYGIVLGKVENMAGKGDMRAKMALGRSPDFLRLL